MNDDYPTVIGPGSPFTLLFDDDVQQGLPLPPGIQAIYGGDWRLPQLPDRPYVYVNFVVAQDGRVSFALPGQMSGGDVSDFNRHDQWLMALLRARADAVLMGDRTMRIEPEHIWTAEYIFPDDAQAFKALRQHEGRQPRPLQVFLSLTGDLPTDAAIFAQPDVHIVVATTTAGRTRALANLRSAAQIDILDLGNEQCDVAALVRVLYEDYGVRSLLCEGGPRVYGAMLAAGQMDDEFLTLAPLLIGNPPGGPPRPGLVEGVAFDPASAPRPQPISLRRNGDHLFMRARIK